MDNKIKVIWENQLEILEQCWISAHRVREIFPLLETNNKHYIISIDTKQPFASSIEELIKLRTIIDDVVFVNK